MNNLPNLSEWHEVPRGTIIPEGTTWVIVYQDGTFASCAYGTNTSDHVEGIKAYTAEPIERTLAQVIKAAYNNSGDWESAAQAARDFLASEETLPPFVIDGENYKWVRNDKGTYDLHGTNVDDDYQDETLEYIRGRYGIQEEENL